MIIKFKQVPLKKTNIDLHDPYVPLLYDEFYPQKDRCSAINKQRLQNIFVFL